MAEQRAFRRPAARPVGCGASLLCTLARCFTHPASAFREDSYQLRFYLEDATTGIPVDLPDVEVNETLPWAVGDRLWPSLMAKLPALPVGLEYRIVGRDLVLVDVSIDLVVDVLEEADRYW